VIADSTVGGTVVVDGFAHRAFTGVTPVPVVRPIDVLAQSVLVEHPAATQVFVAVSHTLPLNEPRAPLSSGAPDDWLQS
jgi:hypothetical protein